jgi:VanZ family protein
VEREPIIARVPRSRAVRLWLPVLVWAALIFALSSIPGLQTGLGFWDLVLRKLAHVAEYAVLGALLTRALGRAWLAAALAVAYAVTDEVHQHFVPGRVGSVTDVAIDALGALLGVVVYRRLTARPRA